MIENRDWHPEEKWHVANRDCSDLPEAELFGSIKGDHAIPIGHVANVFQFTLRSRRMSTPVHAIEGPAHIVYGAVRIFGTISIVTSVPSVVEDPFDMQVYRQDKHVATVRDVMFTTFSREYSLVDRHIYEGNYEARSIELIGAAHE